MKSRKTSSPVDRISPLTVNGVRGLGRISPTTTFGTSIVSRSTVLRPIPKATSKLSIDIVTGKELQAVYFDPKTCGEKHLPNDEDWLGANLYIPAVVLKNDDSTCLLTLKLPNGEIYKVNSRSACEVSKQDDEGVEDILKLHEFSEMSLLHSLRVRYSRDEIYTFVGPILISVNPYRNIPNMYGEDRTLKYHKNKVRKEPHIFVVAEAAYTSLMLSVSKTSARNQAIIISGESGAGKTESTKVIMSYLAKITLMMENGTKSTPVGQLEQRVLNTNPILEAFGNSKTLRNDNSSRFGKFIKIQFDQSGRIVGAIIEKYLLEKTRVQHQLEVIQNLDET